MAESTAELVVQSGQLKVEVLRLPGGHGIAWQRCPVADRVLTMTEGRGYCHRSHGHGETRDEIVAGDVVYLKRMIWHRISAATEDRLVGTLVTTEPSDVEFRR